MNCTNCNDIDTTCFTCNFWEEKVQYVNDPNSVRVDGTHYFIGAENEPAVFRGFGGRRFHVRFNDGREVITTNLWCQGTIAEEFRSKLPDNATFIW
jgi:hypothetical protein